MMFKKNSIFKACILSVGSMSVGSMRLFALGLLFLLAGVQLAASSPSNKTVVSLFTETAVFRDADGPYVEAYLSIDASNLTYKQTQSGTWESEVSIDLLCHSRNDESRVVFMRNFTLKSPQIPDTTLANRRFFLMKSFRFSASPDSLRLRVKARDVLTDSSSETMVVRDFQVSAFSTETLAFSDALWIETVGDALPDDSFTKHGVRLIPYIAEDVFLDKDSLLVYWEYYNMDQVLDGEHYVFISLKEINSGYQRTGFSQKTPMRPSSRTNFLLTGFNIKNLPSQSYVLKIEVRRPDHTVVGYSFKRLFVYNSREADFFSDDERLLARYDELYGYNEKTLDEYMAALTYISTDEERNTLEVLDTFALKRKYFYHFWQKRQKDPLKPGKEWFDYRSRIIYANQHYRATYRAGWRTDRGRVLLTYGPPEDIQSYPIDSDKLPYEIWVYNRLRNQAGVVFVYLDRDLATNDYPLIHSTLQGEIYNANWRQNIVKNRSMDFSLDPSNQPYDNFKDVLPTTTGSPR